YQPVEVVVIDDGSADDTTRLLDAYRGAVRIHRLPRSLGLAAARNHAIRLASESAGYLAVVTGQDQFHPQFVERCAGFLASHPDVGVVFPGRDGAGGGGDLEGWLRRHSPRSEPWLARRGGGAEASRCGAATPRR